MNHGLDAEVSVSVVLPVFNESALLERVVESLIATLSGLSAKSHIIIVDDGSQDSTPSIINSLVAAHDTVSDITLSRNFGKEAAIHAGIAGASGDCVIVMDADFQHPHNLIPLMFEAWREGALVVEGIRDDEPENAAGGRLGARIFYGLYKRLSGLEITNHSDFKLLDRSVADLYLQMSEKHRFFRGLVHWIGADAVQLKFLVEEQSARNSRWSNLELPKYALNNISSFTTVPLQIISFLGIAVVILGTALGLLSVAYKLFGLSAEGFTSIILLLIILGGAIMTSLGIIGHYIGKIYEEVKDRPDYVIKPRPSLPPKE